jgi:hypothetical protein
VQIMKLLIMQFTTRIMAMKNPNDTTGNKTRDPPACSVILQPDAPPHTNGWTQRPT